MSSSSSKPTAACAATFYKVVTSDLQAHHNKKQYGVGMLTTDTLDPRVKSRGIHLCPLPHFCTDTISPADTSRYLEMTLPDDAVVDFEFGDNSKDPSRMMVASSAAYGVRELTQDQWAALVVALEGEVRTLTIRNKYGDTLSVRWVIRNGVPELQSDRDADLPAVVSRRADGWCEKMWYHENLLDRGDDKAAHVQLDPRERVVRQSWIRHGRRQRDGDQPARLYGNTDHSVRHCKEWHFSSEKKLKIRTSYHASYWRDDKMHRDDDKPACIDLLTSGKEAIEYRVGGMKHRRNGQPACIMRENKYEYFLYGSKLKDKTGAPKRPRDEDDEGGDETTTAQPPSKRVRRVSSSSPPPREGEDYDDDSNGEGDSDGCGSD